MTDSTHKKQLLELLARSSFRLGQFKLSSGGTSDYYIDCRTTTLHAEGGRLTGHAMLELLEAEQVEPKPLAGSPWAPIPSSPMWPPPAPGARSRIPALRCCTVSWFARRRRPTAPAAASKAFAAQARAS